MIYAEKEEFIKDFVLRTKSNYTRLEKGPYEVTQLINSAFGLLILPEQKLYEKISDKMVSPELLDEIRKAITENTYNGKLTLQQIAKHLRNSISHARVEFKAERCFEETAPLNIEKVIFVDENTKTKERIQFELSIKLIEKFFFAFAKAATALVES